ncbi:unnamed protein product [Bursaphelenchus xylophilus]|uniref:(pine wood nematode) hypothetical protein n=1 Tax=Bursaphelenchus xylophilus TaxID=6326 RepID=A0A1I7S403_BURXY|nr:unnamed protein product [Bursaphelenchus xylophilus]CAG9116600.1 unnamed protein product [Bursaphelenchus xylophilus]
MRNPGYLLLLSLLYANLERLSGCAAQYRRELRYLDYYLGIAPHDEQSKVPVQENQINHYVDNALSLNCDFSKPCLWTNAPTDDLLDTSDFYLFNKTDQKTFPIQIRPGDPNPPVGTLFAFAGNTTQKAQSAVLLSAPIACQNSEGVLTFKYWLYNAAKVEVVVLRVNPWHNHLQVISRPQIDCHFLKGSEICRVEIDRMSEPFRLGIRVFSLRDPSVGSFGMINDIHYKGNLCGEHDKPSLFGGVPLTHPLTKHQITTGSELNCAESINSCLWSTAAPTRNNDLASVDENALHWQVGSNIRRWEDIIRLPTRPEGEFLFQYADPMAQLPLPTLRSVYIPCTQTSASLSFRFWMSPGIQAQVCTYGRDNVQLSCVYLELSDSPGPLTIDIDSADGNPFAFSFEIIQFSRTSGGVLVIDDIQFAGILCNEEIPTTTVSPLDLAVEFDIQPFPEVGPSFSDSLNCDFETDRCTHWTNEETQFMYGFIPSNAAEINASYRGYAAIALFAEPGMSAELISEVVSCSHGGRFMVEYQSSDNATLSVCANERCIPQRTSAGQLAVNLTSTRPFRIRLLAESQGQSIVIVKRMSTSEDGWCPLESPTQLACKALKCDFRNHRLCGYRSVILSNDDTSFASHPSSGAYVRLGVRSKRAILRSPNFELSSPVELRFAASLSTFGSRLYVCADEDAAEDLASCELVLGPKVERSKVENILVQLDHEIRQFAFVAIHDKAEQFGDAELVISQIQITDSNGDLIC